MTNIDYNKELCLLVVDDVQVHRFLMTSGLRRIHPFIKIDEATSLEEATRMLTTNQYHAVVSDWNMPGGGGAELIRWMRARPHFRRVPFVMISGNTASEDIIHAFMELQVDAYVVKPFTPQDLFLKIMSALEKKNAA
jgi:CheY-like chemotaxis protein